MHRPPRNPLRVDRISTLGGMNLAAICWNCDRVQKLDTKALEAKFGDLMLDEVLAKIRCARCHSVKCTLQLGHDGKPSWNGD